jgi:hypothetical protein
VFTILPSPYSSSLSIWGLQYVTIGLQFTTGRNFPHAVKGIFGSSILPTIFGIKWLKDDFSSFGISHILYSFQLCSLLSFSTGFQLTTRCVFLAALYCLKIKGLGEGGEMTQTLYANMNKKKRMGMGKEGD